MVNHGQRYCSWARTHDGDDNGGVAQDGGHKGIIKGDHLRTVPTFVNAHTFCASRKPWFRHYVRAWLDTDAINYAIKYTTKMKAKFFYRD